MDWFRCYSEFASDSKVQIMPEHMQRRLIMVFCLRSSNALATLHETEIAFSLRISESELAETKALFVQKGFINDKWEVQNWDKRQYVSDTSTERSRKHREKKKTSSQQLCNVAATPPEQNRTDTEQKELSSELNKFNSSERGALPPDFKNLKFEGEFLEIAKSEGWQGESAMVVWKKWKAHFEPLGPAEEWLKSWKKWVLKERKPPNSGSPADEEKALEGEELRIQHLGSAAWRRKEKMSLNPEQSRMLEDYEKLNGIVWWDNLRQYKQGK